MCKQKRVLSLVIVVIFSMFVFLAGCGSDDEPDDQGQPETTTKGTEVTSTTEKPEEGPPVDVTMFFGDAGIQFPADVDKSDNPFLNIIEEAANVNLEITQPAYADF